ncbi:hypothetical protein BpHYR1_010032 [Brachionus plicatilis]|uniref:Uncharacterized protein n=1 Tax=Brachionus plicatilis TaxID=10195 RepID=A0A3M7QEF5_BRAPC|nr:hypothetical protein BpHYR1_010032 [Brachionus plicatilis]
MSAFRSFTWVPDKSKEQNCVRFFLKLSQSAVENLFPKLKPGVYSIVNPSTNGRDSANRI